MTTIFELIDHGDADEIRDVARRGSLPRAIAATRGAFRRCCTRPIRGPGRPSHAIPRGARANGRLGPPGRGLRATVSRPPMPGRPTAFSLRFTSPPSSTTSPAATALLDGGRRPERPRDRELRPRHAARDVCVLGRARRRPGAAQARRRSAHRRGRRVHGRGRSRSRGETRSSARLIEEAYGRSVAS